MSADAADSTRDGPTTNLGGVTDADQEAIDELAAADADFAAGNTVRGEELRRRYGLS